MNESLRARVARIAGRVPPPGDVLGMPEPAPVPSASGAYGHIWSPMAADVSSRMVTRQGDAGGGSGNTPLTRPFRSARAATGAAARQSFRPLSPLRSTPGSQDQNPTVLRRRTDALTVAWRLDPTCLELLRTRAELAQNLRQAVSVDFASGFSVSLSPTMTADLWRWHSGEARGELRLGAPGGWTFELTFDALFLATHDPGEVIERARAIAQSFGTVADFGPDNERVRRGDEACDLVGFPLEDIFADELIVKRAPRATRTGFAEPDTRKVYVRNRSVTGWTVCPGAPFMARVYNKTEELACAGREGKRGTEQDLWAASGWNGFDAVTRVEFQLRTEVLQNGFEVVTTDGVLETVRARTMPEYFGARDALWNYASRVWLTWRERDDEERVTRWKIVDAWRAVQDATYADNAPVPYARIRPQRKGAPPAQARGAAISALAGSGRLSVPDAPPTMGHDERDYARALEGYLRRMMRILFRDVADVIADDELRRHGPEKAATRIYEALLAALARYRGSGTVAREAVAA